MRVGASELSTLFRMPGEVALSPRAGEGAQLTTARDETVKRNLTKRGGRGG
jgi:hypothetical protein